MRTRNPNPVNPRRGVVLVMVLWVVVLVAVIATVTAQRSRLDGRIMLHHTEQVRGAWKCRSGLELTLAVLAEEPAGTDTLSDDWTAVIESLGMAPEAFADIEILVEDESARLNVNSASKEQLMALPEMTEDLANCILDWRDGDEEISVGGAESEYYVNQTVKYLPRNGEFRTLHELLRVRGITDELFFGREDAMTEGAAMGLSAYLTCWSMELNQDSEGNARVNINKADENKLKNDLKLKDEHAKFIVNNRPEKGFTSLADLMNAPQQNNQNNANSGNNQNNRGNTNKKNNNNNEQDKGQPLDKAALLSVADKITLTDDKLIPGRVNLNTAPLEVLEALFEGNIKTAEDVLTYRDQKAEGIESIEELKNINTINDDILKKVIDKVTTKSSVFSVRVRRRSELTGAIYEQYAVVDRGNSPARILYSLTGIEDMERQ